MIAQRRDNNEAEIIAHAKRLGCAVISMDKSAGFDLLVIGPDGRPHIVEVKNPAAKWKIEPAEQKRREQVEAVGGKYHIVFTPDDLSRIL